MGLNSKTVKCFFCGKKLLGDEIAVLELSYCPICFECRKWLSRLKEERFFRILSFFLALVFLCSISAVIY